MKRKRAVVRGRKVGRSTPPSPTDSPMTDGAPVSHHKGRGATQVYGAQVRRRALTLYLHGHDAGEIAQAVGCSVDSVRRWLAEMREQANSLDAYALRSLMLTEISKVLDHQQLATQELIAQLVRAQVQRDSMLADNSNNRPTDAMILAQDKLIRSIVADLAGQNRSFVDAVVRMGVPQLPAGEKNGSHTPPSLHSDGARRPYADMTKENAIALAKESLRRQLEYFEQKEKEQGESAAGGATPPGEGDPSEISAKKI